MRVRRTIVALGAAIALAFTAPACGSEHEPARAARSESYADDHDVERHTKREYDIERHAEREYDRGYLRQL